MLNIELVRFEAQDVITASVMKPHKPHHKPQQKPPVEEPVIPCTCYAGWVCDMNGFHIDADGNDCKATVHNH